MLTVAIGHTEDPDTHYAGEALIKQCKVKLQGKMPKAGLIFASPSYDYAMLLKDIRNEYPSIELVGCSSYGEISSDLGISDDSAALILFASDEIFFKGGLTLGIASEETQENTAQSVAQAWDATSAKPALCCVFADGIHGNVSDVVEGMKKFLGITFPISGGNACDDWKFEKVFQFYNDQIATEAASFLVFSEPLKASVAVCHGRQPFYQKKSIVTRSKKNVVYTIDNVPAKDFYTSQLGTDIVIERSTIPYALMIYQKDKNEYLIRNPFRIFEEDGSMAFAGDVPENSSISISKQSNPEITLDAADECIKRALKNFTGKKIHAALVFSCAVRKEILGTKTHKEIDLIKDQLPAGTPIFGYYTFGEIGNPESNKPSYFHNETIVVTLLGE